MILKERGFSLIQVIVAMAMLSIISLGYMRMNRNQLKQSKERLKIEMKLHPAMEQVKAILKSQENCTDTFLGLEPIGSEVSSIKRNSVMIKFPVGSKLKSFSGNNFTLLFR